MTNTALALLTLGLAGAALLFGAGHPIYGSVTAADLPALDSNLRFLGGIGIGLGLALLWMTPSIERRGIEFRLVWFCAWLGGIGRLISMALAGTPPLPMVLVTLVEVPGVPLLIYWQYRVSLSDSIRAG